MVVMFSKDEVKVIQSLHTKRRLKIFYGILSLQRLGLCQDLIWSIMFPGGLVLFLQHQQFNYHIGQDLKWEAEDLNYTYMDPDMTYYHNDNCDIIDKELKSIYGRATEDFICEIQKKGHPNFFKDCIGDESEIKHQPQTRLYCHKEKFRITGGDIIIQIYTEQQVELDKVLQITSSTTDLGEDNQQHYSLIPETTKSYVEVKSQHRKDNHQQNFVIDVYNNMDYTTQRFYQNNFTYIIPKGHYGYNGSQDTRFNIIVDKGWIFMRPY